MQELGNSAGFPYAGLTFFTLSIHGYTFRKVWCVTHVEADRVPYHAVTIGTTADQAKWFRGSDTKRFSTSHCPDKDCCNTPRPSVRQHWQGVAWPSARDRSNVSSGLPLPARSFSRFPGVDMVEVYEFLERQESQ